MLKISLKKHGAENPPNLGWFCWSTGSFVPARTWILVGFS